MKKLKSKRGFSLVECIVAMAILAVMMLLLSTMLNATMKSYQKNRDTEQEIDRQIAELAAVTTSDTYDYEIPLYVSESGTETQVDVIPAKNGAKAGTVSGSGEDVVLNGVEYDFSGYDKFDKISKGELDGDGDDGGSGSSKVYGAADTSSVTVSSSSSESGGVYTVTWNVSFNVSSHSQEKAVKLSLPSGAYGVSFSGTLNCAAPLMISSSTARIEPNADGTVQTTITFNLSSSDYDSSYCGGNISEYMGITGGSANQANIPFN